MSPIEEHAEAGEGGYLRWRKWYGLGVALGWMSLAAVVVVVVQVVSLGQARRWCQNVVATGVARRILRALGVELVVHGGGLLRREGQTVFIGNHTSTLDFFVVTALGLPNARAFLARKSAVFLPVGVLALALGHFFTVPQVYTERRRRIFARAAERLRASGDSVFLTPEGTRCVHGLGGFNRGAFHLAVALGVPIQPLFIEVPAGINPGRGVKSRPGRVVVRAFPLVSTVGWRVETLGEHVAAVRGCYLGYPVGWVDEGGAAQGGVGGV